MLIPFPECILSLRNTKTLHPFSSGSTSLVTLSQYLFTLGKVEKKNVETCSSSLSTSEEDDLVIKSRL